MRLKTRAYRFVVVGTIALAISMAAFLLVFYSNGQAFAATLIRILVKLPILYLGYSRFVLQETWLDERSTLGYWRAELNMAMRIATAVGASELVKLCIEPHITQWVVERWGDSFAILSPLTADLFYGPVLCFAILYSTGRKGLQH